MVRAVLAPVPQRAGAQEHDVAHADLDALALQGRVDVRRRDREARGQGVDLEEPRDIEQHGAVDDRRDAGGRQPADAEVARQLVQGDPVVGVRLVAADDVTEPIDLGRDVVGDEERAGVPAQPVPVHLGKREVEVRLPPQPVGGAEGHDLGGAVPGHTKDRREKVTPRS